MDCELFKTICDEFVSEKKLPQIESREGYAKIKAHAGDNISLIQDEFIFLRKKLIFEHVVNNQNLEPYFKYLDVLIDALRSDSVTTDTGESISVDWVAIISVLAEIKETCSLLNNTEINKDLYAKYFDFSASCLNLINRGFKIIEVDKNFYIDENSYEAINLELDRLAKSVGGCNLLYAAFNSISTRYDEFQRRFHVVRILSMGFERPVPAIPWSYIIALGVKHSNDLGEKELQESFIELVKLLQDLTVVFELQDYSPYESWYINHRGLIRFLSDEIVYDNLFCIQQINHEDAAEILKYIICSEELKEIRSYGFSIEKIYQAGLSILNQCHDTQIVNISFSTIKEKIKLGKQRAGKIIDDILVNHRPNHNLCFPPKNISIDHNFNQLIPFKESYVLLPKPLSSLAFINNTMNSLICPDGIRNKNNEAAIGQVVERFVKHKLQTYGISYLSGGYVSVDGTICGESDVTIETEEALIFIEIKKKGMTRQSMDGVDYSILSDLGDGLIHASAQCYKAERVLKCDGKLNINNFSTIVYKNQRIFKIALTLNDYGSFQDRMTIRTLLSHSLGSIFKSDDNKIDKKLDGWRKHLQEMSLHINELKNHVGYYEEPFHDLFFMSVPQLLMILRDRNTAEALVKTLTTLSSVSHSTRDFYKEYSLSKRFFGE